MTSNFHALGVPTTLSAILADSGITTPTPIQAATLPDSLAGRDVLGRGRTGSGKTLAFALPLVARLAGAAGPGTRRTSGARGATRPRTPKRPRALVLAPTRELVTQIEATLAPLARSAGLTTLTVFGGVGQNPQVKGLAAGVDIVLACPGRLEDLVAQGACSLDAVEITVLDEADHMADLGFLPGVRRLLRATPSRGQRLLFSATLDAAIDVLVREFLHNPVTHEADSAQSPVATMTHHVWHVERDQRLPVIADLASAPGRTVVFTRTKHGAKALARKLNALGIATVDLHGNLSQNARTRNMAAFHSGRAETLVATDIAARGIHVDDVGLVVHADPPTEHKAYLHRSGRTARAGADGTVVTLATREQRAEVRTLTRAAGIRPTVTEVDGPGHPILHAVRPGDRNVLAADPAATDGEQPAPAADRSAARGGGLTARRGTGRASEPGRASGRGRAGERAGAGERAPGGARTPGSERGRAQRAGTSARTTAATQLDGHARSVSTDATGRRRGPRRASRPGQTPRPGRATA